MQILLLADDGALHDATPAPFDPARRREPRKATNTDQPYRWRWRKYLPEWHGHLCRVVVRGARGHVMVAFVADNLMVRTSRNALEPPEGKKPRRKKLPRGPTGRPGVAMPPHTEAHAVQKDHA